MIYLFYGTDEIRSRDKYNAVINSLLTKSPEASLFRLTKENFNEDNLTELTQGQGLFYNKFIVACDNLLSPVRKVKEGKDEKEKEDEELLSGGEEKSDKTGWLEATAQSENIFIFLENNLPVKILEKLEVLAVKTQIFEKKIFPEKTLAFNIFSLTDAFSLRNRNLAWCLYHEALLSGFRPEEVFWKLVWLVGNLLLVKKTKDLNQLKLKPYALSKTKEAVKKFAPGELENLSANLNRLYHENYLGTDDFELGLERIILSV